MSESGNNEKFIALVDEEGKESLYGILDPIEIDGSRFIAMAKEVKDDPSEKRFFVYQVKCDQKGEYLEPVEEETEFTRIMAIFTQRLQREFFIRNESV